MSGMVSTVAKFFVAEKDNTHSAKAIVAATGLTASQVYNALHYLCAIGALRKQTPADGRMASVYVVVDRSQLERRIDGRARVALSEDLPDAPPLTFFIDADGDLQLVREGEEPVLIRNSDARRLVSFVCLQASAILMAG